MMGYVKNLFWFGQQLSTMRQSISLRLPTLHKHSCTPSLRMKGKQRSPSSCMLWGEIFLTSTVLLLGMNLSWGATLTRTRNPTHGWAFWTMWSTRDLQFMIFSLLLQGQFCCHTSWRLCFTGARFPMGECWKTCCNCFLPTLTKQSTVWQWLDKSPNNLWLDVMQPLCPRFWEGLAFGWPERSAMAMITAGSDSELGGPLGQLKAYFDTVSCWNLWYMF